MTIKEILRLSILLFACFHLTYAVTAFWISDKYVKWDAGKAIYVIGLPYVLFYLYNTLS